MGFQNAFNQLLATTVAGVGLAQHTATAKEQARESTIDNLSRLAEEKNNLSKEKLSLEVENQNLLDKTADEMADLKQTYDANINKAMNGKITMKTLQKRLEDYEISMNNSQAAYTKRYDEIISQRNGINERVDLLNKRIDLGGKKYEKIVGKTSPLSELEKLNFNNNLNKKVIEQVKFKTTDKNTRDKMDKLNEMRGKK